MRHLYPIWFGGVLVAVMVFGVVMFESVASVSPLRFNEEGLPFVWDKSNPLPTLGAIAIYFVAGLIFPIWLSCIDDGRFRDVFLTVISAATTGMTMAALVCFLLSLCVQAHIGSCMVWLLGCGFITARVWQAGLRES